ncbi:general secretion pathway protein GspN [Pseudomonas sp. M47T1]|uniref:hypothetical protein n=1 Tax=Pseudomonas sp. M47T1 TaxID=1179778 RepID=UPI00026078FA|nr:hypothetical protein [Pseudomonas sp. M47T1]EIK94453.1 general secretion pathway protein GspN [Pseudomonas sp. M47T1]
MKHMAVILLLINGALVACLVWVGASQGAVEWNSVGPAAPLAVLPAAAPALTPLPETQLAQAFQQPLFSPDRSPDAAKAGAVSAGIEGVTLGGVVINGQAQWALLRLRDQRAVKLKRGDALDGGWVLTELAATSATFTRQGQARTVNIPVPRLSAPAVAPVLKLPDVNAP